MLVLALVLLAGAATYAGYYESEAKRLTSSLLSANVDRIGEFRQQLGTYSWRADRRLKLKLADGQASETERLRAQIGLVERHSEQADQLQADLLDIKWAYEYLGVIGDALRDADVDFVTGLWPTLRDPAKPEVRFRAGLLLAIYAAGSENWSAGDFSFLAGKLVSTNPVDQKLLWQYLQPLARRLIPELEKLFANQELPESQQIVAASALAVFASDDGPRLARLLTTATSAQYEILYPRVSDWSDGTAKAVLGDIVVEQPTDTLSEKDRMALGQRRANAAVTLLRLGEREQVLPVFEMTDDPEALTQFIFRCRPRGVSVDALLDCLQRVSDGPVDRYGHHARYALLLALGEFTLEKIPASRRTVLLKQLADWYRQDPSSGVHGATGWLLRQWGQADVVREVDQTAVPYAPDREWFTLAITVIPTPPPKPMEEPAAENAGSESEPPKSAEPTESQADEAAQPDAADDSAAPPRSRCRPRPFTTRSSCFRRESTPSVPSATNRNGKKTKSATP